MKDLHLAIPIATVLMLTCQLSQSAKIPLVKLPELSVTSAAPCEPTLPDALGPFYKPSAPERSGVGQGYVLSGMVKSSVDCSAIERARIEFWLAGPNGQYDDRHRATIFSDKSGAYRFESNFPPQYSGRPPHIHIRVSAKGYQTLITQHHSTVGQTQATFDLVLIPGRDQ
jgi:hypothetical protein